MYLEIFAIILYFIIFLYLYYWLSVFKKQSIVYMFIYLLFVVYDKIPKSNLARVAAVLEFSFRGLTPDFGGALPTPVIKYADTFTSYIPKQGTYILFIRIEDN